jgi:hypothetical protein
MNIFSNIALRIIQEQERIIGPLAWAEASKVPGMHIISQKPGNITIDNEDKTVIDRLVNQYEKLFGRASREACRNAAAPLVADLSPSDIPSSLQ